jgi:hypothetical protein
MVFNIYANRFDSVCNRPGQPVKNSVPSHPVPWRDFELVTFVPLSRDNEGTSVPLSQKVALSCSVGNARSNQISSQNWHWKIECRINCKGQEFELQ